MELSQWIEQVNNRKLYLNNLIAILEKNLQGVPEGKLRVSNNKGIPRYYWIKSSTDTRGKYIAQKDRELIEKLAQKDYMRKIYQQAKIELDDIEKFLELHNGTELEEVYSGLNQYRKELITPLVVSDERYAQMWEQEMYNVNPYYPEEKVYATQKDELVRSKSEVMLADMYYELGIPYRYEAELCLQNGKKKYPDFTLLNISNREVIYHEHLGLMDDEQYRKTNLMKLDEYRRNGIYLGKNLIITYEAEGCYLNIREIKKMCREMFRIK